ncbi:ABC transporter ATP-binding protein [Salinibius halmophilus]|uniref:ABC transporter ATP-binding protein n=1 Tax=Salinibius halmophilus TaxID=1853216 RepID=UPI000E671A1B|nr:ABC transporter ATP-binding protein [Salinibius halmophilus]
MTAQAIQQPSAILRIDHLKKTFGTTKVLEDINIDMPPGGFLVLVGPSGCGKSTLLNCIAGLEETSAGHIHIDGREVTELPPRERDIAMVFQSYALYPTMTVRENIAFGMKVRRIAKDVQTEKVDKVAKLLKIEQLLHRKPSQLSGGQRQRVAMGRALVRDPALFLFDEPLSNLDAKLRVEMRAEIKQLHEKTGASFVYVTHDQVEAMTMGSQIAVLNNGYLQQLGTPDEIYNKPANIFVASFMGSPPMNILSATYGKDEQGCYVEVNTGAPHKLYSAHFASANLLPNTPVKLGIRPEAFEEVEAAQATLSLNLKLVEITGADTYAVLDFGDEKATARLGVPFAHSAGDTIHLHIDPKQMMLFDAESEQRLTS